MGVEDQKAFAAGFDLIGYETSKVLLFLGEGCVAVRQFFKRDVVNEVDGGAGQDVVELVGENATPDVFELFLGEFGKAELIGQYAQVLDGLKIEFRPAVAFLDARYGSIGAAVELQVEFAAPDGQFALLGFFVDLFEGFRGGGEFGFGQSGEAVFLALDILDHFGCGAAAAVAVAVGVKDGVAGFLGHEAAVGAKLPGRQRVAGVGRVAGSGLALVAVLGSDKVRKDLGAVDALPLEDVPGHPVGLVPADLGGNEGVNV